MLGLVAARMAENKGRRSVGWFIGVVLLGPIGIVLAAVISKDQKVIDEQAYELGEMKKCPYCSEIIKTEAVLCRYCWADLPADAPENEAVNDGFMADQQEKRPASPSLIERGLTHAAKGEYKEAVMSFSAAIDKGYSLPKVYYCRAITYNKMGDKDRALDDLKAAAKLGYKKALDHLKQYEQ